MARQTPRLHYQGWGSIVSGCNCIGPQNGQPLCPCQMRGVAIINGRYVKTQDLGPAPDGGLPSVALRGLPRADWVHKESSTRVIDSVSGADLGPAD